MKLLPSQSLTFVVGPERLWIFPNCAGGGWSWPLVVERPFSAARMTELVFETDWRPFEHRFEVDGPAPIDTLLYVTGAKNGKDLFSRFACVELHRIGQPEAKPGETWVGMMQPRWWRAGGLDYGHGDTCRSPSRESFGDDFEEVLYRSRTVIGRKFEWDTPEPEVDGVVVGWPRLPVQGEAGVGRDPEKVSLDLGYMSAWVLVGSDSLDVVRVAMPNSGRMRQLKNCQYMTSPRHAFFYPIDGWTVVGVPLQFGWDANRLLGEWSRRFGDAQLFVSDRSTSSFRWERWTNGELVRKFSLEDGRLVADHGALTDIEQEIWGTRVDAGRVTEDHVAQIAERWGLSPDEMEVGPFEQGMTGAIDSSWSPPS